MTDAAPDSPLDRDEEAVVRLLRAARRDETSEAGIPDEDALTAYAMGTASPEQVEMVQAAMVRSPHLRRALLDVMEAARGESTSAERLAFDRSAVPSLQELETEAPYFPRQGRERSISRGPTTRRWVNWALGGWAVAATASACVLLVLDLKSTPVASQGSQSGAPRVSPPRASSSPITLEAMASIRLIPPSRSSSRPDIPTVAVLPSSTALGITVDPPDVPGGTQVHVTLTGPSGGVLVSDTRPVEDFAPPKALLVRTDAALQPGTYTLYLSGNRDGSPEEVRYSFRIEARQTP